MDISYSRAYCPTYVAEALVWVYRLVTGGPVGAGSRNTRTILGCSLSTMYLKVEDYRLTTHSATRSVPMYHKYGYTTESLVVRQSKTAG